jgi:hypothetical protein
MVLKDYSGPYKHDLKFEDFSKEFLIKLMKLWQGAYLGIQGCWYETVAEKYGPEVADSCSLAASLKQPERVIPQYAELGNIKFNTVLDSLKAIQLAPDGHTGSELFGGKVDIKNENHVIATTTKCVIVELLEKGAPEKIEHLCHVMEKPVMEKFLNNPKIKVTPLKRPPRKDPNEIFCKWELKLEK